MRTKITKSLHKTKVSYSYVLFQNGKTFTDEVLLDNWLSNFTFILHKLEDILKSKNIDGKVYSINSVEQIKLSASITDEQFQSIATIDLSSIVVIKKLR